MTKTEDDKFRCNSSRRFILKGVYDKLEKLTVPETPVWRQSKSELNNMKTTSDMLEDIVQNSEKCIKNTQGFKKKLDKLKVNFVLNSNIGENEGTKTFNSTESAVNKKDYENLSYDDQVSKNLFTAINYLEKRNMGEDKGMLDVEECIQDTHKIVMKNLLKAKKCGEFSTEGRLSSDGHVFPNFATTEEAYNEVQRVVDKYNSTIEFIKKSNMTRVKQYSMYIRCAAWILYNFVTLHPFSDGNGRMCRLLASHCLYLVFPFPCPIYNIHAPSTRADYLSAINKARKCNGENLGDLVALIIESGWYTTKHLAGSD